MPVSPPLCPWYIIILLHFSFFLVNKLIAQEGPSFLQMRIKHLLKSNCIPQATALSKLCAESKELSQVSCFQQAYVTCLCSMLPSEEAIQEVSTLGNYSVLLQMWCVSTEKLHHLSPLIRMKVRVHLLGYGKSFFNCMFTQSSDYLTMKLVTGLVLF